MRNFKRGVFGAGLAGLVMSLVVACGGGGGGSFAGIDRLGVTTGTITGFGSIIVNGVEYETNGASFNIDDDPAGQLSSLQVGQIVTVRWSSIDEGVTRRADDVYYDDAVEGPIEALSINRATQSFVVLGQTVLVDADTSFASPLFDLDSLTDGDFVEVSGLLDDSAGPLVIRATRIERKAPGGEIEIRGTVTARTATTFAINGQVVNTVNAVIDAPGGTISDGDFVEAKGTALNGSNQLIATRVELEDGEDRIGDDGDDAEVEGYVTAFTNANAFSVAGIPVQSSVTPEGGTVALGAKVRVEGEFNASGAIVASEVKVRAGAGGSPVDARIAANVDSVDAAAGELVVLGITVQVDANTRLEDQGDDDVRNFTLADLRGGANPDYVEVRGVLQDDGSILATLLQRQESDVQGLLRGRLAALADPDFTLLGVTVATDGFTGFFLDDGNEITAQDFFGGVAVVGDELKVKFLLNLPGETTPILADEVEIQLED